MIIFLYGQDSYRAKRKLDEIIAGYKKVHKSGLNLIYVDAKETDFNDFFANFKINSMFAEKKLIVLKNVFDNEKFQEYFIDNIKSLESIKDIIVVFEIDKVDQRNKLFKLLKKIAKCQEFNLLEGAALKKWLQEEVQKNKAKIDPLAENMLFSFAGNNLWNLANETKKLCDFKQGKTISKEDVELMIRPKIEIDIFKTIDALSQKDKKQALSSLHKHIEAGESPLYLLSMVAYQFRNILIIKELIEAGNNYPAIIKKSGLHPFVVKKNYYLCSQFSMAQLKKIYQKIFLADLDIKTGKVEPETALDLLLAEI